MNPRPEQKPRFRLLQGVPVTIFACLWPLSPAPAAESLTPQEMVLPPEQASEETLNQTARQSTLRLAGLDIFPHAAATVTYDDNVLIAPKQPIGDVEWTFSPGLTAAAGDICPYLATPLTLDQVRGVLSYPLFEETDRPRRFLGIDYTLSPNFFTRHTEFDNVDSTGAILAGYAFSRLSLDVDQDFAWREVKDVDVDKRVPALTYTTKLRATYELSERSTFEADGQYYRLGFPGQTYQGYQEFRNEDWFNRQVGARLSAGLGMAFGWVLPDVVRHQAYQQPLARGTYLLTGKLSFDASAGVEWREYGPERSDTINPVVQLQAVYQPSATLTLTAEGHRRDQPSFDGFYNYQAYGFSTGVRQAVLGHIYGGLSVGYDNIDYQPLTSAPNEHRLDDLYFVRVKLDYQLSPQRSAGLFYLRQQNASSLATVRYKDDMVGCQLSWRF